MTFYKSKLNEIKDHLIKTLPNERKKIEQVFMPYINAKGGREPIKAQIKVNGITYYANSIREMVRVLEKDKIYLSRATITKYNFREIKNYGN